MDEQLLCRLAEVLGLEVHQSELEGNQQPRREQVEHPCS